MGPGTFFFRLGYMGPLALVGYLLTQLFPRFCFSMMRQFGQTSLLVYWIHVELVTACCSSGCTTLGMGAATVGFVLMTAAMLGWPSCGPITGTAGAKPRSPNRRGTCSRRPVLYKWRVMAR